MNQQDLDNLIAYNKQEEARLWEGLTPRQQVLVTLGQVAYKNKDYKMSAIYARQLGETGLSITQAGAWLITP